MKKIKMVLLVSLMVILFISSFSVGVAGRKIASKQLLKTNIQPNIEITSAVTNTFGQIYRPGGKIIRVEKQDDGFNGLAKAYDEEPEISAAHTFNKASGKETNDNPSSNLVKKTSRGLYFNHRNHQAAGQLKPMDKSAAAMGTTGTDVSFIPKANHDGMIRLNINIEYSIMVTATEDFIGQTAVFVQYFDEYNIDEWSFELNDRIELHEAGEQGYRDSYSFFVDVPSGTECNINVGTSGASGSLILEDVTGMCQALADLEVKLTMG